MAYWISIVIHYCRILANSVMYFTFTPLLLKSYISFTGSQRELHIFLHEIRHL